MQALITFLIAVPAPLWGLAGAIFGALAALLAAGMANRGSTERLRLQLAHDAAERAEQRRADLRKEVFLDVAAHLMKANALLGSLALIDVAKRPPLDELNGVLVSAMRVQMVSSVETAAAASGLLASFEATVRVLLESAAPAQKKRVETEIAREHFRGCDNETRRILSEIALFDEGGAENEGFRAAKHRSYGAARDRQTLAETRLVACESELLALQQQYARDYLPHFEAFGRSMGGLMAAMRAELGTHAYPPDVAVEDARWKRAGKELGQFVETLGRR
ncbi:hypothetical protein [Niveibacterium sp. SC-1]|uniref:hypothetical protein n=1 Tax=Niveibacterium sp. SC-1 TaxID=3135646 RepID=UPI00311D4037